MIAPSTFVISPPYRENVPLGAAFWVGVGALFVATLTPREAGREAIALLVTQIDRSPYLVDAIATLSRKAASGDREALEAFLLTTVFVPTRKILFLIGLSVLAWPLVTAARTAEWCRDAVALVRQAKIALVVCFGLLLLVVPGGLRQMGDGFARLSEDPFGAPASVYARRLLVPALAEASGFRGGVYYLAFSFLLGLLSVLLLVIWCERARLRLPTWVLLSIASSSFIVYNHLMPGYVDQMLVVLVLSIGLLPLDSRGRLAIVALGLVTHELSLLLIGPVVIWAYTSRERTAAAGVILAYATYFAVVHAPWIPGLAQEHLSIAPMNWSPLEYARAFPGRVLLGIAAANKAFWLLMVLGVFGACRARPGRCGPLLFLAAAPFLAIPFAVDTSRFAGWTFVTLLVAIRLTAETGPSGMIPIKRVALANLFLPSVYVGLNVEPALSPGLYSLWRIAGLP